VIRKASGLILIWEEKRAPEGAQLEKSINVKRCENDIRLYSTSIAESEKLFD